MANELILMAEPRDVHGKKVKRLRREGLIPGVVYGPVVDGTVSVSVNDRDFNKFFMAHGHSTIFTLKWDGGSQPVLVREVQRDPNSPGYSAHRFLRPEHERDAAPARVDLAHGCG